MYAVPSMPLGAGFWEVKSGMEGGHPVRLQRPRSTKALVLSGAVSTHDGKPT